MKSKTQSDVKNLRLWLTRELRSDHAGETGAIAIYDGILAVSRNKTVRDFALKHRLTEKRHLALIEEILPVNQRSRLLPLWILAGFLTGAVPALFGSNSVFATVAAVENFVDTHYAQQTRRLAHEGFEPQIAEILESCRQEELNHRDEAIELQTQYPNLPLRVWCQVVSSGSNAAVAMARWI